MSVSFDSEAGLCSAFSSAARADGWTVYPEQGSWDLLLVRGRIQVGIQVKLVPGWEVLLQALPVISRRPGRDVGPGPTYRAVLVPGFERVRGRMRSDAFYRLALHLRLLVFEPPSARRQRTWLRVGWFPGENLPRGHASRHPRPDLRHYRWRSTAPVWTPPFVPDLPAGVPSPSTVSPFMIAAVRLERLARSRGWVSLEDAREASSAVGGAWDARTLIQEFFRCSNRAAVPGKRGNRWYLRPRGRAPSARWPAVADGLSP